MSHEPEYHPEELEAAKREGRPTFVHRLFRYDHLTHELPLGSLVDVDLDVYDTNQAGSEVNLKGRCTLFVVGTHRDCDGTPLYVLSSIPVEYPTAGGAFDGEKMRYQAVATYVSKGGGYSQDSLTPTGKRVVLSKSLREYFYDD